MVTFSLILLTIGIYYLVRDVFHPAFIMLFFWTAGFFLMSILPGFYFPSLETQVIIFIYLFIFLATSVITTYIFKIYSTKNITFKNKKLDSVFLNILIVLCSIALMYYIYQRVVLMYEYSSLREYFFNIRFAALEGNPLIVTSSLMQMFKTTSVLISIVVFYLINISKYNKIKKTYYVSFIVLVQIASLIEGSRNEFIMMAFSYILIYGIFSGFKGILKFSFYFILTFFIISMYTRGGKLLDENYFIALSYFFEHLFMYMFGSIISFETFLNEKFPLSSSIVSVSILKINNLLELFGLNKFEIGIIQGQIPFTNISDELATNVYSFLAVRIYYFGYIGAVIITFFHALIISIVYLFHKNNLVMFFIYVLMSVSTVLSLFHEYFYAYLPYYIRMVFFIFVLYYLKPIIIMKKVFNNNRKAINK